MRAVERALQMFFGTGLLLGMGCHHCEQDPPSQRDAGEEIDATQPCLDRATANQQLVGREMLIGGTILSIDSEPSREDVTAASASCCYENSSFRVEGALSMGKLCTSVSIETPNDVPDSRACPSADDALDGSHLFRLARDGQVPLGVPPEEVESLGVQIVVEDFVPGTDFCTWKATVSGYVGCH